MVEPILRIPCVTTLALDLAALLGQWQSVNFNNIVQHPCEDARLRKRSQSKRASSENGSITNHVRFTEPKDTRRRAADCSPKLMGRYSRRTSCCSSR